MKRCPSVKFGVNDALASDETRGPEVNDDSVGRRVIAAGGALETRQRETYDARAMDPPTSLLPLQPSDATREQGDTREATLDGERSAVATEIDDEVAALRSKPLPSTADGLRAECAELETLLTRTQSETRQFEALLGVGYASADDRTRSIEVRILFYAISLVTTGSAAAHRGRPRRAKRDPRATRPGRRQGQARRRAAQGQFQR